MTNPFFHQTTGFVCYKLANATDAQLKFVGMTPDERDKLLTKDIEASPFNQDPGKAYGMLYTDESEKKDKTVIYYRDNLKLANDFDVAAHELFHAARFWSRIPKLTPILATSAGLTSISVGAICSYNSGELNTGLTIGATCATVLLNTMSYYINNRTFNEEKSAYRFGALFNPDLYMHPRDNVFISSENSTEQKISLFRNHPTVNQIKEIYNNTKKECEYGNILFPRGDVMKEFYEWKKSDDYHNTISKIHSSEPN